MVDRDLIVERQPFHDEVNATARTQKGRGETQPSEMR
jgi:hypothetical protein